MAGLTDLLDWRRETVALYAEVGAYRDPPAAWHRWRSVRDRLFREHAQSPLEPEARVAFRGLPYFDYDPRYRFAVRLEPVDDGARTEMYLGADGLMVLEAFARTLGLAGALGAELTLYWIGGYGGGAFLPFGDATNGRGTFAGGRYLLDTIKGADLGCDGDGHTILDFNFAYNPSCAYSARWVCPLAPEENRLPRAVSAGERSTPA